ncbi:MAG: metallophosphoesterase family protein [Leptospiraceae bacterium]
MSATGRNTENGRTIFIGDVHGCAQELKLLVQKLELQPEDRVVMLGDLINRGPDPAGVVDFVFEQGFECLKGNHEDEYLRHYHGLEPYASLRRKIGDEKHSWIESLPLWIESDDFMAVHAGLEPYKHPSQTSPRVLLTIRTWDGSGIDLKNPDNPAWYEFYHESKPVFYGHWARRGLNIRDNTVGLDSGCVYGRALSAYILETRELVQLPALKTHYIPPSLRHKQGSAFTGS